MPPKSQLCINLHMLQTYGASSRGIYSRDCLESCEMSKCLQKYEYFLLNYGHEGVKHGTNC